MLTICLQSGSNGNAIYVEAGDVRLLFDAGISARKVADRLAAHGRLARGLDALLLSHDHLDHTCGAGALHRRFHVPMFATPGTLDLLGPRLGRLKDVRPFESGQTLRIRDVQVHTMRTPHDTPDGVAFVVEHAGRRLGIFTDLGRGFAALHEALESVDAAYLESNYDPHLLASGGYPAELKRRIRGGYGHLSNDQSAELLCRYTNGRLQWVALAHLSAENNHPRLALETHRAALGSRVPIWVASRHSASAVHRVD